MTTRILVTGGLGFVGSCAVSALARAGHRVRVLDVPGHPLHGRFAEHWAGLGPVEILEGDIAAYPDVREAVAGCERILHAAALTHSIADAREFRRTNVTGTENVCRAALATGVQRLVAVSTSDVFGIPEPGRILDETSDLRPWGEPYPDTKLEAVRVVRRHRDEHRLPATIAYPGWVYGPGDRQFFPAVLELVQRGHALTWHRHDPDELSLVYIDDLVDALLRCLLTHERDGEYLLLDTETSVTAEDLLRAAADSLGKPVRVHHVPYPLMLALAAGAQWLARRKILPRTPLTTTDVRTFGNEFRFSNRRAAEELGWRPSTPVADGLRRSLEWQRRRRDEPGLG